MASRCTACALAREDNFICPSGSPFSAEMPTRLEITCDHRSAFGDEGLRRRQPDPRAGSGNDDHLARQPVVHGVALRECQDGTG